MAVVLGLAAFAATFAPSATAAPPEGGVSSAITPQQSGGILDGTFSITSFTTEAGELIANGVFTGTVNGVPVTDTPASAPVADPTPGSCRILDLTLGPLHLDLLGLVVDLNEVHLTITAERGPGNLLGNLLCAVAGLLDEGADGSAIQELLDQINAIIARLLADPGRTSTRGGASRPSCLQHRAALRRHRPPVAVSDGDRPPARNSARSGARAPAPRG